MFQTLISPVAISAFNKVSTGLCSHSTLTPPHNPLKTLKTAGKITGKISEIFPKVFPKHVMISRLIICLISM